MAISRDADHPFRWDDLTNKEREAAHADWLALEHEGEVDAAITSHESAAELLSLAAEYLEQREQMPHALADYVAGAFRTAIAAKETEACSLSESRKNALADALNITNSNRRPKVTAAYVGPQVLRELAGNPTVTDNEVVETVAKECGQTKSTVLKRWQAWKKDNRHILKIIKRK